MMQRLLQKFSLIKINLKVCKQIFRDKNDYAV